MYGERSRAQMREESRSVPRFSIFFCGCKQPKSIHILLFAAAKVRISERNTKEKRKFFLLILNERTFEVISKVRRKAQMKKCQCAFFVQNRKSRTFATRKN